MTSPTEPTTIQRQRRPLRTVAAILIAAVSIMLALGAFFIWRANAADKELAASQAWARQTTTLLRTLPGGEKMKIFVPLRIYSSGPDWYFLVGGAVLDDATDARLHAAFDAAGPPKNIRIQWKPTNCGGDAEAFKNIEAEPLDTEDPTPAPR